VLGVGAIRRPWREVADKRRQVDFDKSLRPSAGPCPIKPPESPVGQKAPAHGSIRLWLGAAEIAQDLRRRRLVIAGGAIEPRIARLVLDDNRAKPEPIDRRQWPGARLSFRVDKQQRVGDVVPAAARLLLRQVLPAEAAQYREDEFGLGLRLGGMRHLLQMRPMRPDNIGEGFHFGDLNPAVLLHRPDAVVEKVTGKKCAAQHVDMPPLKLLARSTMDMGIGLREAPFG
jgi:hypothetical protein